MHEARHQEAERCLWASGEDDPFGDAPIARQPAARIPGSQLELVADARHAVWVDEFDHTAAAIARFVGTLGVGEHSPQQPPDTTEVGHGARRAAADRDAPGAAGRREA